MWYYLEWFGDVFGNLKADQNESYANFMTVDSGGNIETIILAPLWLELMW